MPLTRYFRRAAFTLACLSWLPAGIGIRRIVRDESDWSLPIGVIVGELILLTIAVMIGVILLLAWGALKLPSALLALSVGAGLPAIAAVALARSGGEGEAPQFCAWTALLVLPIVLGGSSFVGKDGRQWLRRGGWTVASVLLPLLVRSPYWQFKFFWTTESHPWLPVIMAAVLGLVLYWSVPGKPVRGSQLFVEELVAVAACALISFAI